SGGQSGASLWLRAGRHLSLLGQEFVELSACRRASRAADARAFDCGDRRSEAHRLDFAPALGDSERKAAVQGVAGSKSVDRLNGKDRQTAHCTDIKKDDVAWAVADGHKGIGVPGDALETIAEVAQIRCLAQTLGREDDVRGDCKQWIVFDGRPVAIDND